MPLTFHEQLAAVALALVRSDQLSEIATLGLTEGYQSWSLAALAGQSSSNYDPWDCRRLWDAAVHELNLAPPTPLDAAKSLVRAYARMVVASELTPRNGAAMIVNVVHSVHKEAPTSKYIGDAIGAEAVIGFFYQHDDCGFLDEATHQQIDKDIVDECHRIVGRWTERPSNGRS